MSGSSKSKSKNKDGKVKASKTDSVKFVELENQLIFRMPEPYASTLQDALKNGGLKDRLQIKFDDDVRHAAVTFDGVSFSAKLYDFPCVIESWKTFDKKSLWKTGDLCQILICRDPQEHVSSSEDEDSLDYLKKQLQQTKKYQYPHGLTPPLKNVRKRRFRKTAKQKYVDAPEIEKEIKRLLRADVSAVNVKYEIINDELDKQKQQKDQEEEDIDVGGPSLEQFDENSNVSSMVASDTEEHHQGVDILPDISSSEDEGASQDSKESLHASLKESLGAEFEKRLVEIKTKKFEQEMKVQNAANPFLKQRFQLVLDGLIEEEEELKKELAKNH